MAQDKEHKGLGGVIAAVATPVAADLSPDLFRFARLARWLLDNGCDGLNVSGTTGEATSFTVAQRLAVMGEAARALPVSRLMVGTGAAAAGDAVELTVRAADLGFSGALVLPPFYYKGVDDDGVVRYLERIVEATADDPIDIYLYNFPALSGVPYTPALVRRLVALFGSRIAGLKDSSGDLGYAREIVAISPGLRVFPSNEAVLLQARAGEFAGCISASANVNAPHCRRAFHDGDAAALERAVQIRTLVSKTALIPSIKAVLAAIHDDDALADVMPPLSRLSGEASSELVRAVMPLVEPASAPR